MKRFVFLVLLLITCSISFGQNIVYDENAEVRTVERFNSIEVSGTISMYLSQGTEQGIAVSAGEEKYNNKIKTEVRNGVLKISVDGGVWNSFNWTNKKLKAYVTVTDLNRLDVSGASYASIEGSLKINELNLDVSGASEVKGSLDVNKLNMDVSGASVARLSGTVREGSLDASGAAKIQSYNLVIDTCKAASSGASGIRVTVNGVLVANASGGSVIYYRGPGVGKVINSSAGASIKNRSGSDD